MREFICHEGLSTKQMRCPKSRQEILSQNKYTSQNNHNHNRTVADGGFES